MTTTQSETTEVARYLAAIRDALADLSPDERGELLEDLEAHLHEVIADSGTNLEASLGSATKYAAELRASAGLEPGKGGRGRLARARTAWESFAARPASRSVGRFLVALRPAWWLARGWLALMAFVIVTDGQRSGAGQRSLWLPTYYGTAWRAVLLTAVVALASAWVGTRTTTFTKPAKRAIFAVNILVIGFAIVFSPTFIDSSNGNSFARAYSSPTPLGLLTDSTGHVVTNAYPQSVSVLPFVGPAASASAAALRGPLPASGPTAISRETVVPAPAIVVPPLATPAPTRAPSGG